MQEIIKSDITYNIDDLVKGNIAYGKIKYPFKSRIRLFFAVLCLFLTLVFLTIYKFTGDFDGFMFVTFAFSIYYFYSNSTYMKRAIIKRGIPTFSYNINSEGFKEYNANVTSDFKWENFTRAIFIKNFAVGVENKFNDRLFLSSSYTEEEFNQLKEWIKAKVKAEYKN